jgi:hypothetical protein
MFVISLPPSVRVGNTVDCRINKKPAHVTWREAQTLVIEPDDARRIVHLGRAWNSIDGYTNQFICADADGSSEFEIITDRPQAWRKP